MKAEVSAAASDTVSNIVYTVVFDVCNEMIAAGMDQAKVLEHANVVVNKNVDENIRMRKKPAPRAVKPKPASSYTDVTITAPPRKMKPKVSETFVWLAHQGNPSYCYTKSARLATGYPVKDTNNNKIIAVIDDTSTHALSPEDVRIATSLGLQIDFSAVSSI